MDYEGCEIVGCYLQKGFDLQPIIDSRLEEFERKLDLDKIEAINNGRAVNCDRTYWDFQAEHPEHKQAFISTKQKPLENYLKMKGLVHENGKPSIILRCSAAASLIFPVLNVITDSNKTLVFRKTGSKIFIETKPDLQPISGCLQEDIFKVSEDMIVLNNPFDKMEQPTTGETGLYRVVHHKFRRFDLFVSKEIDAGMEEPIEIRGLPNGGRLNMRKLLFKTVFLAGTRKAVINLMDEKDIKQVVFIDDLEKLDYNNFLDKCHQVVASFGNWLLDYLDATKATEGTIHVGPPGIIVKSDSSFAIFSSRNPEYPQQFIQCVVRRTITSNFNEVVQISTVPMSHHVIRGLIERTFCATAEKARIEDIHEDPLTGYYWPPELCNSLKLRVGGPRGYYKKPRAYEQPRTILHLVGKGSADFLKTRGPCDLQLIDDFCRNGLLTFCKKPDEIAVSGTAAEFDLVLEFLERERIEVPVYKN